jgi:hypothetical protein
MAEDNGGAAFPIPDQRDAMGNGIVQGSDGMSLRDYFAAAALPAVIETTSNGSHNSPHMSGRSIVQAIAMDAYDLADAMLSARKKETGT